MFLILGLTLSERLTIPIILQLPHRVHRLAKGKLPKAAMVGAFVWHAAPLAGGESADLTNCGTSPLEAEK